MGTPKVSVIIPCYNRKQYIDECIRSVLASTLKDIEVVLVDDGSSDETKSVLAATEQSYPNVKVVSCQHKGPYEARWTGLSEASGEYVHFMDSDDIVTPDCYEVCYSVCKRHDLDTLIFKPEVFNNETHTESERSTKDRLSAHFKLNCECCNVVKSGKQLFYDLMKTNSFFVAFQTRLFRRSLLSKPVPKCNAFFHGDNYYSVVWLYHADRAMSIDNVLLKRRAHANTITMSKGNEKKHLASMLSVVLSLCKFAPYAENCNENGSAESQYVMRCVRGMAKRMETLGTNAVGECFSQCVAELDYPFAAFVRMCFFPMFMKFAKTAIAENAKKNS